MKSTVGRVPLWPPGVCCAAWECRHPSLSHAPIRPEQSPRIAAILNPVSLSSLYQIATLPLDHQRGCATLPPASAILRPAAAVLPRDATLRQRYRPSSASALCRLSAPASTLESSVCDAAGGVTHVIRCVSDHTVYFTSHMPHLFMLQLVLYLSHHTPSWHD